MIRYAKFVGLQSVSISTDLQNHSTQPSSSRMPLTDGPTASTSATFGPGFSPAQQKFAHSTVRSLRRNRDATPFNQPVDIVALNIPHYPSVITQPMDLGTIERKINATKKGAPSDSVGMYHSVDEFADDVRRVWNNSYVFNGREHAVSLMANRLSDIFEKQLRNMPPFEEVITYLAS